MIHELQMKMTDLSASDKSSEDPATPLLSSSSMLIPCDSSVESERDKTLLDDIDKVKNEVFYHRNLKRITMYTCMTYIIINDVFFHF